MAIVGPSGSGKSTLLRLVAGFMSPDAGEISLDGRLISSPTLQVPPQARGIGYVSQDGALFPHLTVARNIGFGVKDRGARAARVQEVAELVGLEASLLDRFPSELSGGQQQRVALGRALAPSPTVILMDEPFSALDTGLRAATREAVIMALDAAGVTTLLVTHDHAEAMSFGSQIAVLENGRLVQWGPPDSVFENPSTQNSAGLLGSAIFFEAHAEEGAADGGSVASALGRLEIRHDRSGGARNVRAMVRPSQLDLATSGEGAPARVLRLRPNGPLVAIDVVVAKGTLDFEVTVTLPRHRAREFEAGQNVRLLVHDGVVVYPRNALENKNA
jgi:iron(III) transport system ATP-binding protein